jgi:hypothetical protein
MEIYVIGCTSISSLSFCIKPYHSPSQTSHNQNMNLCVDGELNILLPQTSHNQHQNMNLCVGGELNILLPQTSHNQHQNMNLYVGGELNILLSQTSHNQHQNFHNNFVFKTKTHYKGRRSVLRSQASPYILTQRKQVKNLPKVILHII